MVNQEGQGRTGTRGQGDLQRPTPNDPLPPVLLHLLSLLKVPEPPKIAPPAGQSNIQPRGTQIQTIAGGLCLPDQVLLNRLHRCIVAIIGCWGAGCFGKLAGRPARITGVRLEATCKENLRSHPQRHHSPGLLKKNKIKKPTPCSGGPASRPGIAEASVHRCVTVSPGSVGVLPWGPVYSRPSK